ncbi:Ras- protein Rab-23 [Irineochytrium annulatum]|nr:Ras- protein Rab-23 [Irineochytrium annulatum]
MEDVERQLKVLVVGNGCVGKSSMIRRLCKSQFCDSYKKTIGVDYSEAELDVPNFGRTRLMLWDTAGQEEFDPVTRQYYEDSFETIKSWRKKVEAICSNVAMVLVQNKIDLNDEASVSP